jgi:hypothetical protein
LVRQTLACGGPDYLHAIFDAGAGKADAGVRALWNLVEDCPNVDVTLRACRYPHRVQEWKALPSGLFVPYQEEGPYVGAPLKEIRLAETQTVLKEETADQAVRTLICREIVPGPKKDRWHPLFTTSGAEPPDVLRVFRSRQHHEQAYRVGVYDEGLDAVPCAYDKHSPDPKRPRFHRGPLQMLGWLLALVYNAVADLSASLPEKWAGAEIRKLRRAWFNRPDTGGVDCVPGSVYGSAHVGPSGRRFQPGVSSYSLVGGPSASHILKLSWPCRPRSVVSH